MRETACFKTHETCFGPWGGLRLGRARQSKDGLLRRGETTTLGWRHWRAVFGRLGPFARRKVERLVEVVIVVVIILRIAGWGGELRSLIVGRIGGVKMACFDEKVVFHLEFVSALERVVGCEVRI